MGNRTSSNQENQPALDHLTADPRNQETLRRIYASNSNIPAFPGAALSYQEIAAYRSTPIKMKKATPLRCNFLFEKTSIELIRTIDPDVCFLSFKFSCETTLQITIYFHAKDIIDDEINTQNIFVETEKYPAPKSFVFVPGKNQKFSDNSLTLDLRRYTREELAAVNDEVYPMIIKFESVPDEENKEDVLKTKLYTYYTFKLDQEKFEAKYIKQKFEYKNRTYLLDDIYGTTSTDDGNQDNKDCAICLSNKLNTIVLPCKHICLCVDCAKNLRDKNNQKCPMCRKYVETFLILKKGKKHTVESTLI